MELLVGNYTVWVGVCRNPGLRGADVAIADEDEDLDGEELTTLSADEEGEDVAGRGRKRKASNTPRGRKKRALDAARDRTLSDVAAETASAAAAATTLPAAVAARRTQRAAATATAEQLPGIIPMALPQPLKQPWHIYIRIGRFRYRLLEMV